MGSLNQKNNWLLQIYQSPRSVFGLADVALLTGESNAISLTKKLHYQVGKGNLKNPRKGLYTKPIYEPSALACTVYTPSYLSLDYVLQKEGVIFQYDSTIMAVSYLSRALEIDDWKITYSKIKDSILYNTTGVISYPNGLNVATKERAFLDILYLKGELYFDSINTINTKLVQELLPIYESKALEKRVMKLLEI
jgi:hypothetical protein